MTDLSHPKIPSLKSKVSAAEWAMRVDVAACYRLIALFGMNDLVYNHISGRVPGEEGHFLINPYGYAYEEVSASSLVKIDFDGKVVLGLDVGDLLVFEHGKELKEPKRVAVGPPIKTPVRVVDGVMYLMTSSYLYAIEKK